MSFLFPGVLSFLFVWSFGFLLFNPPFFIFRDDIGNRLTRHEPLVGFVAGPDGMAIFRRLIPESARVLRPRGWAVFELEDSSDPRSLFSALDWTRIEVDRDSHGSGLTIWARRA